MPAGNSITYEDLRNAVAHLPDTLVSSHLITLGAFVTGLLTVSQVSNFTIKRIDLVFLLFACDSEFKFCKSCGSKHT